MGLRGWKRYGLGAGGMLVLVMALLLATGWGSAVAAQISSVFVTNDAAHPVPVAETRTDAQGNIKVHEQGTANVNVTNSGLSVAPPPPVTNGGGSQGVLVGEPQAIPLATASALTVGFESGALEVHLVYQGNLVAAVVGEFAGSSAGSETVPLALTRPIKFDFIACFGIVGKVCRVAWVGAQP
jgi:uncharacterized membrane protein YfcA